MPPWRPKLQKNNELWLLWWIWISFQSFLASGDFCYLLISFANSLDPDQDRQNVGPDLFLNCLTRWFLREFFENVYFEKSQKTTTKPSKITQHAKTESCLGAEKSGSSHCLLLLSARIITFATRLDPDQAQQNSGPGLSSICLTLKFFSKKLILKNNSSQQKRMENFPGGKKLLIVPNWIHFTCLQLAALFSFF